MSIEYAVYLELKTFVDSLLHLRSHIFVFHFLCYNCNCTTLFPTQCLISNLIDEVDSLEETFWCHFWYDPSNPSRACFDTCMELLFIVKESILYSLCNHVTCNFCIQHLSTTILVYNKVLNCFKKKR